MYKINKFMENKIVKNVQIAKKKKIIIIIMKNTIIVNNWYENQQFVEK